MDIKSGSLSPGSRKQADKASQLQNGPRLRKKGGISQSEELRVLRTEIRLTKSYLRRVKLRNW